MPSGVCQMRSLPVTSFAAAVCQSPSVGFAGAEGAARGWSGAAPESSPWLRSMVGFSVLTRRALHQFDQNATHIFWVHEDDRCPMGADPRLAEHLGALALHFGLGFVDVGHFEAD